MNEILKKLWLIVGSILGLVLRLYFLYHFLFVIHYFFQITLTLNSLLSKGLQLNNEHYSDRDYVKDEKIVNKAMIT